MMCLRGMTVGVGSRRPRPCGIRSSECGIGHVRFPFRIPTPLAPLLIALCFFGDADAFAETVNRIVAVVNDDIITQADVAIRMRTILLEQRITDPTKAEQVALEQVALRTLIEQRLMLQEAKRLEVTVPSDEVAERLDLFRARFDSDEAFEAWLTEAQVSEEQLKEKLRDQLMVQRVIDGRVRATIMVSPQEVARDVAANPDSAPAPGDRVRASHLLVRVNDSRSEAQARDRVEGLHRQLKGGADFAELAKRYSEDPHAEQGGMMGWVAKGELLPELDAALFSLEPGVLSDPIRTRLGFHLVRVEERQAASKLSVTDANQAVFERLYQQKFEQALGRWLNGLKRRAYIEMLRAEG